MKPLLRRVEAQHVVPVVGVGLGIAHVTVPHSSWTDLSLYVGSVLLSFVAALVGWRRSAPGDRRFSGLLSLALGGFAAGEVIWWWYTSHDQDPYPSIGDGAFLLGYVPLALAAGVLASQGRKERDRAAWLDAGILTSVAGLVVWQVLMEPYLDDPSMSVADTLVSFAYPLADLLILGVLLVLLFSRTARNRRSTLFAAGAIATLTADLAFAYQDLHDTFTPAGWVELSWMYGFVLLGTAALTPPDRAQAARDDAGMRTGRLVCTVLAVLVPPGAILLELDHEQLAGLNTLTIAVGVAAATLVLVALRMWGLLGRARRVEQRRGADRLSTVIHHSADAILLVDRDRRIMFASPALGDLAGTSAASCIGTMLPAWFADDPDAVVRQLANLAAMPQGAVVPLEGGFVSRDGTIRLVEGTACNLLDDPSIESFVVALRDVSVRRELEEQLERRAFHDELTGLANRALFADRVTHALERLRRTPEAGLAVVFIDLDDFKAVNDGMGHAVGDELLVKVADRLRTCLRPADTVARFGGDEFAILLEDVADPGQAEELAARLVEVLRMPLDVGDLHLGVPASVGVALAVPDSTNESLMRDADIAMYSAKAQGKCRVAVFDDKLRDLACERLALKVELPQALPAGQFQLCYQPIHDVALGHQLSGFEALIRWNHPVRGLVPPLEFIPLAEETGDIVGIGRWVLEEACRQAVTWNERATVPLTMSVNVSAVQLHQRGYVDEVQQILESSGLPGHLLTIELTESVLVDHDRVEGVLERLRALGVGLAIDDFGTGYSSLSYLKRFPVTAVKIDRSFITDLATSGDAGLVRSIVAVAEALALTTVAEGVETIEQLEMLASIDCRLAQGYFLGRPLLPDQIDALLSSGAAPVG